jgi:large subunit ribosomal protein L17
MFSNMITSLVLHERIETTVPKAKELKRLAERAITWGISVADLTVKGRDKLDAEEKARIVHAMRMARRVIRSEEALSKLFSDVALRFRGRTGGYTRLLKTRNRRGDCAPMSFVELVVPAEKADAEAVEEKIAKGAAAKKGKAEAATDKAVKKK